MLVVIPVLQRGRADILQQNNARCHVARHTMFSHLQQTNILTHDLPLHVIRCLINSLRRRCAEVVKYRVGIPVSERFLLLL